jgi:hypothetical protein
MKYAMINCTNVCIRVRGSSKKVFVKKYEVARYVPVAYSLKNIGLSKGNPSMTD